MTSTYAAYHTIMAQTPYDQFTQEPYQDMVASSQGYVSSASFDTPLTTMDNNLGFPLSAYSDPSRNDSLYPIASSGTGIDAHMAYSPAQSPGEHLAPPRFSASSESGTSVQSTSSSSMGSPHLNAQYSNEWNPMFQSGLDNLQDMYFPATAEQSSSKISGFVDPSVVAQPYTFSQVYPDLPAPTSPGIFDQQAHSPATTATASRTGKVKKSPAQSPFNQFSNTTYPYHAQRRQSTSSSMSRNSSQRSGSFDIDEVDGGRGVCPIQDCGKSFKDLKAHMLTHQNERPEKCPITSCEYHIKGFARKYDKNRHTLTHYKGTMVCGFCPGSGSSAEKSFNRADVFKRHLTSVHGVEQVPPNARRKSSASRKNNTAGQASGQCSTCGVTFPSAQDFYEHLDDCVLRVVQQIDPAEAINEKHLTTINEDKEVQDMLEKHNLTGAEYTAAYDEDDEDDDEEDGADARAQRSGKGTIKVKKTDQAGAGTSWNPSNRVNKRRTGLTLSKGGVRLAGPPNSGRKKRKNYPASWGCSPDKMRMKKRVLCAYDGQRRLWKDDLMLDAEFEVRIPLPSTDGRAYITDLDIQTMRRAEAIFSATEEERGPWVPDNIMEAEIDQIFA